MQERRELVARKKISEFWADTRKKIFKKIKPWRNTFDNAFHYYYHTGTAHYIRFTMNIFTQTEQFTTNCVCNL